MGTGRRLRGGGWLCCQGHALCCSDLVAGMLGVPAASGQALFQRDAAFGDGDAVACDFHCVLSVAVSGLCQQKVCFS